MLYSTGWCRYCKKARQWLVDHNVDFVEKDIEKEPEAATEVAIKATRAGVRAKGVPIIDVRGSLVFGYDELRLRSLLKVRS